MAKRKLTDVFIKSIQTDKRIEIFDTDTSGLALRVTPTGHKSFFYRYRYGDKIKRFTIGKYSPPALTLKKARDKAKEIRVQVNNGKDPQGEKQRQKHVQTPLTFKELAEKYKTIHLPTLREKTQSEHGRIIDNELIPAFGKLPASEITKTQIITFLDDKAIKNGKKTMANRIRARFHSIYEFGLKRDIVEKNPVSNVPNYPEGENKRERFYNEKEIVRLWNAFEQQDEPSRSVLKFLLVTAQRSRETRHLRWEDINDHVWTIPKNLSKSHREHQVPLTDMALQIIEKLRPVTGKSEYVFESPVIKNNPIKWIKRSVENVQEISKVSDFRLHDLRRTAATYMGKLKYDTDIIGRVLNHKTMAKDFMVTSIYNRYKYLDEKREALEAWNNYLFVKILEK